MGQSVRALSQLWSGSPEIKSELINSPQETDSRITKSTRAMVESWYGKYEDKAVFDKCRAWNHAPLMFHHLFPDGKIFVCVRDLRSIFASIEKHHGKNPLFEDARSQSEMTVYNRADRMMSPQGLVGQHIEGVEDMLRRSLPFVEFIPFEVLSTNPKLVLEKIYSAMGMDSYEHDFTNVEKSANDIDGLYLNKFPHDGSGAIAPPAGGWQVHVPAEIAGLIMQRFTMYNRSFGYI